MLTPSTAIQNYYQQKDGIGSLTSHSTHYRSFRRRFYRSDDPTNSVIALKDDSLPDQGPIPQAQHTKR